MTRYQVPKFRIADSTAFTNACSGTFMNFTNCESLELVPDLHVHIGLDEYRGELFNARQELQKPHRKVAYFQEQNSSSLLLFLYYRFRYMQRNPEVLLQNFEVELQQQTT